jgi:hypothetical protein
VQFLPGRGKPSLKLIARLSCLGQLLLPQPQFFQCRCKLRLRLLASRSELR